MATTGGSTDSGKAKSSPDKAQAPQRKRGRRGTGVTRMPKVEETSAGGLVIDRSGPEPKAALIARHDRRGRLVWSLPKGHLEEGEIGRAHV